MRTLRLFYAMHHRKAPARRTREDWGNFGDELNPILFQRLFGIDVQWASAAQCDALAIGSVLDKFCLYRPSQILHRQRWLPHDRIVWGSGFMFEGNRMKRGRWNVAAVRGPLTQARMGALAPDDIALGDPGLLAGRMLEKHPQKTAALGVIAHYVDRGRPELAQFLEAAPHRRLINVMAHPDDVLEQIAGCDAVLSSSLHGLIAADALGVPNARLRLSGDVRGGDFKFSDYWAAIGKAPMSAVTLADIPASFPDLAPRSNIDAACDELLAAAGRLGFQ